MATFSHQKKFGQNFLESPETIGAILDIAGVAKADTVIEVGPGHGALTFPLTERAGNVIAVEKDRELVAELNRAIKERGIENVSIVESDIRDIDFSQLVSEPFTLVGNIPYYLTSNLFRRVLEESPVHPKKIVFMIQKEVAERIAEREPRETLLSISVQVYGTPAVEMIVPRHLFSPPPEVDSAIISVSDISRNLFREHGISEQEFFSAVRAGFSQPRKLLSSNLSQQMNIPKEKIIEMLESLAIKKEARAGELPVEAWFRIAKRITRS